MFKRAALALSLAIVMPSSPAFALEVKPTGVLFSDYELNLSDALSGATPLRNSFNITRARIGLEARMNQDIWGRLMVDNGFNLTTGKLETYLKYGFVDVNFMGLGRMRGGAMDTLWAVPIEDDWYPFRFQGAEFTIREGLFPTQDRGVMWYGGMGPVQLALAAFNGEGDNPTAGAPGERAGGLYTKAYEGRLRVSPMEGAEIALGARVNDAPPENPRSNTLLGGLNLNLGPAVIGAEGAYNMVTDKEGKTTNGMGGSGHVYFPKVLMGHTPVFRADYYDADPTSATSNAHYRLLAGLDYEWIKGVDTMLSYEYEARTKTTTVPPDQKIGIKSGFKF